MKTINRLAVIRKMAEKAYSSYSAAQDHRKRAEENEAAESTTINDLVEYAIKYHIHSKVVEEVLINVGYAENTAKAYASRTRVIKRNKHIRIAVANGTKSADIAYLQAKETKPDTVFNQAYRMLLKAIEFASDIGIKKDVRTRWFVELNDRFD